MLFLFNEIPTNQFQELMTKVLLERFIGHRPHPWGAMVTFIELLRNPRYDFWNKEFTRIAPEITAILENVSILALPFFDHANAQVLGITIFVDSTTSTTQYRLPLSSLLFTSP